ncbi:WavE lipopolysaccharide synthesis family protein [Bremerella sp. JC770]|uniref:WavE lipopolysaccharide synthesis family protein n=1 Tax=Bremerella sp. JC770 TaxID=3232137 RepID=UPI0034588217
MVQGPVVGKTSDPPEQQKTRQALESARRVFPDSEIILSTWQGTDVDSLPFDKVVFSPDPGGFPIATGVPDWPLNNVNRQLLSTLAGLKQASGIYAMKLRSDFALTNSEFCSYFGKYKSPGRGMQFVEERVLSCSIYARNPRLRRHNRFCMHPSDFFFFGNREDLLRIFDRPLVTVEDQTWFHERPDRRALLPEDPQYDTYLARYCPEQSIWIGFVEKYTDVPVEHAFDRNKAAMKMTEESFAANLVILEPNQLQLVAAKPKIWTHAGHKNCYSFKDWQCLYDAFCENRRLGYRMLRMRCALKYLI